MREPKKGDWIFWIPQKVYGCVLSDKNDNNEWEVKWEDLSSNEWEPLLISKDNWKFVDYRNTDLYKTLTGDKDV